LVKKVQTSGETVSLCMADDFLMSTPLDKLV